jgi:hypothetical protein
LAALFNAAVALRINTKQKLAYSINAGGPYGCHDPELVNLDSYASG